jgi:oxygen-independent coproporphyrinogen-3 oxidase
VIDGLRRRGVTDINLDLIYGLPYQTSASVVATVDQAVGLSPSRIALFGYAHVPWMKKHQKLVPESALPDIVERWRQYDAAAARLGQLGYVRIGLDHFARPDDAMAAALATGHLHRNFQGYTTDEASTLLGLGASGIGSLPQGYVANESEIHQYKRLIRDGRLATRRGIAISPDDRLRRAIIERLMCDLTVDIDAICAEFAVDPADFDDAIARLAGMEADGVVTRQGRILRMTEDGRPLVRAVCAVFDRYLVAGETRHSKAV